MHYQELDTPCLLIDRERVIENIDRVQSFANAHHVALRPHTKTHKMPEIAKLQLEHGACGIAVAKVGEAEVMAHAGITDILIANEIVGSIKLHRICALLETAQVAFGVDTPCQVFDAEQVFSQNGQTAQVYIEIEVGENRSGVTNEQQFSELLSAIGRCPHVQLKGLFSHDGNSYRAKDLTALKEIALYAQRRTLYFAKLAREAGFPCPVISYGATPTILNDVPILDGITELRLGTYVFMDAGQSAAIHTLEHCAATVLTTVISRPTEERVVFDVGAKGLTMQTRTEGICAVEGKGILFEHPEYHISGMYDEHSLVLNRDFRASCRIGEKYRIIPVHICPAVNLYGEAWMISGNEVVRKLQIACRGKLQ